MDGYKLIQRPPAEIALVGLGLALFRYHPHAPAMPMVAEFGVIFWRLGLQWIRDIYGITTANIYCSCVP
ncbi:MAG: hypothetical protein PVJ77_16725, partial [Desulfobacterales bacterium]